MKVRNILLLLAVALQCISCESFLDVKPVGKIIPRTYLEYKAILTSAYKSKFTDRAYSALLSDEAALASNSSSDRYYKDIYVWNVISPDAGVQTLPWLELYSSIFYANHVIKNMSEITEGSDLEINQLVGEAYLIRAYLHFNLVNLYADHYGVGDPATQKGVPIVVNTAIDVNEYPKLSSVKDVYEQIVADLESGISKVNVIEQPKGQNFRFSKISAYGFAARVYLYMGNFEKSLEYAQKALAINSSLEDLNSASAIMPYKYKSVENVLALENTFTLPSELTVSTQLLNKYNVDKDLRIKSYYTFSSGLYKIKLGGSFPENKVSMRTAEFYLVKAEAIARSNGKLTDAKETLKVLLKNRLTSDYYTLRAVEIDAMGKDEFVQLVFDERARELAFQGFRWFDLKRNGKPEIVKEFKGQTYILKQNDPRYVVRFPKNAIAGNPNLAN